MIYTSELDYFFFFPSVAIVEDYGSASLFYL